MGAVESRNQSIQATGNGGPVTMHSWAMTRIHCFRHFPTYLPVRIFSFYIFNCTKCHGSNCVTWRKNTAGFSGWKKSVVITYFHCLVKIPWVSDCSPSDNQFARVKYIDKTCHSHSKIGACSFNQLNRFRLFFFNFFK